MRLAKSFSIEADINEYVVRVWDVATGKSVRRMSGHKSGITRVAFDPTGKLLASGDGRLFEQEWAVAVDAERGVTVSGDGAHLGGLLLGWYHYFRVVSPPAGRADSPYHDIHSS